MNLVVNAKDSMSDGDRITVQTAVRDLDVDSPGLLTMEKDLSVKPGRYAEMSVFDNGTGLGLSMVYGFLKQSGGHITVTSEVGKGSAFKVYSPLAESEGAQWQPENGGGAALDSHGDETLRVLISSPESALRIRFKNTCGLCVKPRRT